MIYDCDYFIDKFEKIPESKWCINKFVKKTGFIIKTQQMCAQGHCMNKEMLNQHLNGKRFNTDKENVMELAALAILFGGSATFDDNCFDIDGKNVAYVNNGEDDKYPQLTPKKRILAALYDIKAMQEKENISENKTTPTEQPKKVIEYRAVRVPETILNNSELTKETN